MYAVGGHDGWSYLTTVERWDPQTKMWSYVAPMSTARSTVGVAVLGNKLVNVASHVLAYHSLVMSTFSYKYKCCLLQIQMLSSCATMRDNIIRHVHVLSGTLLHVFMKNGLSSLK